MANHPNRGRLTVDLGGNWRLYTETLPRGSIAIGSVTRGGVETGALVLMEATGLYVQVGYGCSIRNLDQRKVMSALRAARSGRGGPGRGQGVKTDDGVSGVDRVNVTLDRETRDILTEYGDSQLSMGIRRAARRIKSEGKA